MTRTSCTSLITIAFAAAGFAMFSHGASASTNDSQCSSASRAEMAKDTTGCRETTPYIKIKHQRLLTEVVIEGGDGGGGGGGKGGRGGRGGQK